MAAAKTTKTMALRDAGGVLVFYHSSQPPSDAEWDAWLEVYRRAPERSKARVFVYAGGSPPNAAQRARMKEAIGELKPRVAVVTPSSLARAAGTAIRWFNPNFRAFAPNELDRAFEHLSATPDERRQIEGALYEMKAEVMGLEQKKAAGRGE